MPYLLTQLVFAMSNSQANKGHPHPFDLSHGGGGRAMGALISDHFAKRLDNVCTPENPIGSCMVSSEGACAAHYTYGRHKDIERDVENADAT